MRQIRKSELFFAARCQQNVRQCSWKRTTSYVCFTFTIHEQRFNASHQLFSNILKLCQTSTTFVLAFFNLMVIFCTRYIQLPITHFINSSNGYLSFRRFTVPIPPPVDSVVKIICEKCSTALLNELRKCYKRCYWEFHSWVIFML